jgi:hypothetical protein
MVVLGTNELVTGIIIEGYLTADKLHLMMKVRVVLQTLLILHICMKLFLFEGP